MSGAKPGNSSGRICVLVSSHASIYSGIKKAQAIMSWAIVASAVSHSLRIGREISKAYSGKPVNFACGKTGLGDYSVGFKNEKRQQKACWATHERKVSSVLVSVERLHLLRTPQIAEVGEKTCRHRWIQL